MIKKYIAPGLVIASVVLVGCSGGTNNSEFDDGDLSHEVESPPATPGVGGSVYDTLVFNNTQFSQLRKAIDLAGLANVLDDESKKFTLFAPDDAAFELLNTGEPPTALDALMADTDALMRFLQYHVVSGSFDEITLDAAAAVGVTLPTLIDGESLAVTTSTVSNTGLAINGVSVSMADMVLEVAEDETTSGIVHAIAEVLNVPEAIEILADPIQPGTVTEGAGVVQATLESMGDYTAFLDQGFLDSYETNVWTVFAPTDKAVTAAGASATLNVLDLISVNAGALNAVDLLAAGTITTHRGSEYAVTGSEDALLVDGKAAVLLATGASGTLVYSLDGILGQ